MPLALEACSGSQSRTDLKNIAGTGGVACSLPRTVLRGVGCVPLPLSGGGIWSCMKAKNRLCWNNEYIVNYTALITSKTLITMALDKWCTGVLLALLWFHYIFRNISYSLYLSWQARATRRPQYKCKIIIIISCKRKFIWKRQDVRCCCLWNINLSNHILAIGAHYWSNY